MSEDGGIKKLFHDLHDTVPAASKLIAEMRETIGRLERELKAANAKVDAYAKLAAT